MNIRQIIPENYCSRCNVCCRFPEATSELRPVFLNKEIIERKYFFVFDNVRPCKINAVPFKDMYICPHFNPEKNTCSIYKLRPFDCRLYPFMLTYNKDYTAVELVADSKCPFVENKNLLAAYAKEIYEYLEQEEIAEELSKNFSFINNYQDDCQTYYKLTRLTDLIFNNAIGFKKLALSDKKIFESYLKKSLRQLSAYSFQYLYAFSDTINTLWKEIDGSIFILCGLENDYFMPVVPFGKDLDDKSVSAINEISAKLSQKSFYIENVSKKDSEILKANGYKIKPCENEYLLSAGDIAAYKGGRFKSKRSLFNHFSKNYSYKIIEFDDSLIPGCLELYRTWADKKLKKNTDPFYKNLIEDSILIQKKIFENFNLLGLESLFIDIEGSLSAYTVGYPLNEEIFAILFEVTDPGYKGISEFIASEFAKKLIKYKYLNIMGDSGIVNLRKTKLSYNPEEIIPSYSVCKV